MDDEIFGGRNDDTENNALQMNNDVDEQNNSAEETQDVAEETVADELNNEINSRENEYQYDSQQYNNPQFGQQNGGSYYQQNNNYYRPPMNQQPYSYQQPPYGQGYNPQPNPNDYQRYVPQGGGKPPKKKNTGMKVFIALVAVIVVVAIASMVSLFSGNDVTKEPIPNNGVVSGNENATTKPDTDNVGDIQASTGSNYAGEAAEVAAIAKKYNVGILVYQKNSLYTEGSGVVIKEDNDGKYTYIITCAHVVNHSNVALSVLMEDGTEYPADLVGMDTRTDLAVVRIEASGLNKAEIASSENLIVGQYVYAIGNPGGSEFFGSVTNGIISAIARPVSSSTGYEMECIQHTSAINPGNSGGALVNGEGKLIGINSMKIASTEYEGMGFAVPSDVVVEVFNSIIANGYVAGRAKLGISYATPSNYSQTYAMYVQMKGLPTGTIVIAEIGADSDLANKDVKVGDMIIAVNGKDMTNSSMLADMIEDMSAGDSLTLTIVRVNPDNWSQTQQDVKVTLVEDRGTSAPTTESSESQQNPFSGSEDYQNWYDYYKDFFGYGY